MVRLYGIYLCGLAHSLKQTNTFIEKAKRESQTDYSSSHVN